MKKVLCLLAACLAVSFQIAGSGRCEDKDKEPVKSLLYRQKEFQNQWSYLSDKEQKASVELNAEVNSYNQRPSLIALQRMEGLKIRLMENLQDQVKNDRDYILFLELKLSEILGDKFKPLSFEDTNLKRPAFKELKEELPVNPEEEAAPPKEEKPKAILPPTLYDDDYSVASKDNSAPASPVTDVEFIY